MAKRSKPVNRSDTLARRLRDGLPFYLMMAPFFLLFFLFIIVPVLSSIVLSLTDFNMVEMPNWVGFEHYTRMFLEDDIFIKALMNTLLFAVITGPVGFILSFVLAWFINELGRKTRSFITLIMYSPTLAGNVYFIWTFIFSGDSKGLLNNFLIQTGLLRDPISWLTDETFSFAAVVVVIIWSSLGSGFLALVAGFKSLDKSYYEAAALDGIHNRWQELYYVTLPQMGSQLLFSAVMSISQAFAVGYQSQALTGFPSTNYSTHTILLHIIDYGSIRFEMGYASALAVVLFAMMLGSWFLIRRVLRRFTAE